MKVAVVILNWNGKKFLQQFLPDVIKYTQGYAEIVVADNASTDDSVAFLHTSFPAVRIIQHTENGGFAKGYNDALKQIDATYFVLLNSDVLVTDNWIQPIITLMDQDNSIAACQPKLLSFVEKQKFEYAGAAGGFIDTYGYPFCRGRLFLNVEEDLGQYNNTREVFWATGACMFVRAEIFHALGGFDEDFFAHMEEIDLCWRMKIDGYKIMYCSESKVYHVGGGTLPKSSPFKTYLNFRNNLSLLTKNMPLRRLWFVMPLRLVLDGIAGFKFLLQGDWRDMFAVIRAHFSYYIHIPFLLKKRKRGCTPYVSQMYKGNIVVAYYLKQVKEFAQLHF